MPVIKLKPSCKDYLWGGTRLKEEFAKTFAGEKLAETWELSCHPDGACTIAEGPLAGTTLQSYLKANPNAAGKNCDRFPEFPILVKLIDAKDRLSIQVHPDDSYALSREGQFGKTEMWYVLDCEPGAFLYYGLNREVTREEFRRRVEENTLLEVLNPVPVNKGDSFFIQAGTIHAIGAGIVIAEIQQSSNLTYRVYDYARIGAEGNPRELHVEKAVEVASLCPARTDFDFGGHLAQCAYFTVDKLELNGLHMREAGEDSFHSVLVLEGSGVAKSGDDSCQFAKGDSLFLPAGSGAYSLEGIFTVLITTIPPEGGYRVGIDLGGTNIKAGLVDDENRIIAKKSVPTNVGRPWQEVAKDMADEVLSLLKENGLTQADCRSIGIGSPGTIDADGGEVVYSNNFYWEHIPLVSELKKYFTQPIHMSNDANCAALGEVVAGAAKGCKSAVLLTLGTGVGGGVVLDGKVFEGGFAGGAELGHMVISAGGELCTCGRKGCLEAYASATALIKDARCAAEQNPTSLLNSICGGDLERINGIIPFEAADKGDDPAKKVVENYIENLGIGIVNLVNIFRPEKVIISGGVCGQGEKLTKPLSQAVSLYSFAGDRAFTPTVVRAELGNDAGIIGAAALAD